MTHPAISWYLHRYNEMRSISGSTLNLRHRNTTVASNKGQRLPGPTLPSPSGPAAHRSRALVSHLPWYTDERSTPDPSTSQDPQQLSYFFTLQLAVSNKIREYHVCNLSIKNGMGPTLPSTLCALIKKQLFNPSTTSLLSSSISVLIMNSPSDSRGPGFRGVSPHRTVISVGVFSTTSK